MGKWIKVDSHKKEIKIVFLPLKKFIFFVQHTSDYSLPPRLMYLLTIFPPAYQYTHELTIPKVEASTMALGPLRAL